jgi:phosphoribosylformylglycinamidine cyclo-ligase
MADVFKWLGKTGNVAAPEMLRVFNCGVGMALVVTDGEAALAALQVAGETPFSLGHVSDEPGIVIENQAQLFS